MATRRDVQARAEKSLVDQTNVLAVPKLIAVFCALSLGLLTSLLDQNGVSTALPAIAADLNAQDTISWAGTSSLIANTTFQMLYGRLSDIFGRKGVFLTAIFLLVIADIACSRAHSAAVFYVFRGVAGVATGGVTNVAMIIVSDVVTLEQRGTYQGILGAMVGVANAVGPFIAAACVERLSWRAFFYILAPLAAAVCVSSFFLVPAAPMAPGTTTKQRLVAGVKNIDVLGTLTSSAAVIFLLIPISGGGAYYSWNSPMVISMLVLGGVCLALFVVAELRVARLPMMPLSLFHNRAIVVMLVQNFLFGAVYQSSLYYVPLYLQNAHQYSAVVSAAVTAGLVAMQTLFSILSGLYISWRKRYIEVLWLGFTVWTLGAGLTLLYNRHTSPGILIVPLLLSGIGIGCIFQPTLVALQAHAPKPLRAVIISNRNFFRSAGGACGLAISAAVLQAVLRSHLPTEYKYLASQTYSLPEDLPALDSEAILDAYMAGSHAAFILQVPLIALCLFGTFFIKDSGLRPPEETIPKDEDPAATAFVLIVDGQELGVEHEMQRSSGKDKANGTEKETFSGEESGETAVKSPS
ncbi:hypothetical protein SBRCBS47491_009563 [Sporothrix bragantina]|uniref:Major facilitator superfamily (MFS) profile domain-containing protein n=1 Tax=Sporothrix bragantina TaxID=671064 RepID=A0ABP0CY73_9PEZI